MTLDSINLNNLSVKRGTTLIEVLLYVGIMGTMVLAVSFFLTLSMRARVRAQTIAEVEQAGVQIISLMTQAIRNSGSINAPAPGASASSLSLAVADGAKNPTILNVTSGTLNIKEGSVSLIPLVSARIQVAELTVINLSRVGTPGTVRIRLTLMHSNPEGVREYDYAQTFTAAATVR